MAKAKKKKTQDKSNQVLIGLVIAILAFGGGFLLSQAMGENESADHDDSSMTTESHSHSDVALYNVPAEVAPTVAVAVNEDAKSGWNVQIITTGFTFTPENASSLPNVIGEGHAHLYVDGEKVARVYGNWFHYPENFDGTKEFKVTLNANDHSDYAINDEVISASVSVTHDHSSSESGHSN